jgi:hypothetical protein
MMKNAFAIFVTLTFVLANPAHAGTVHLVWNPNTEIDLDGYVIYYGKTRGVYDTLIELDDTNTFPVNGLDAGVPYFFRVTALDYNGNESGYSETVEAVSAEGEDENPPYLTDMNPSPGSTGISPFTTVYLEIRDDMTGVNLESIQLHINGQEVTPWITGSPLLAKVEYVPPAPPGWGSSHQIEISAFDQAASPNYLYAEYVFTICTQGDFDTDALPDEWEAWGSLDAHSGGGVCGPAGDPDGDHLNNCREFEMGLDPTSPESLVIGAGPGPGNLPVFRLYNACGDLNRSMDIRAFPLCGYGLLPSAGDIDNDGLDEILAGPGPGPDCTPLVKGFEADGKAIDALDFTAYNTSAWGVRTACGDLDGDGRMEILTGPGPSPSFGPHVKGWQVQYQGVTRLSSISFFAYGTKKFGVNVQSADLDADGRDEILTGPGQGHVFGPHVRAFNYENQTVTPMAAVNFFAYATRKYGVNVSSGDVDADGFDEIITGAGPGVVFGPHVRAFNFDNQAVSPMTTISYFAYNTRKYGVNILGADPDGDRYDELVTAPGPSSQFGAYVRIWNYDGDRITACGNGNFFAFPGLKYGATLAKAQLNY